MKTIKLLLAALLFCATAIAQSPAGTKPLPKQEEQPKDSILADGLDAYLNGLKDDDGDDVLNKDDACPKEKGTAKNKGCPESYVGKDEVPFTVKEKKVTLKDADEKNSTDIEKTLLAIFTDARNDFKKYIGEPYGAEAFGIQSFEYGLTLGGEEKMYKYYDEHNLLGFNARFKTEDQFSKAVILKATLESVSKEMVSNKYNYTQKQIKDLIIIINTDGLKVYDYKLVNNKLTELNIYSSGAEQLARNRKEKEEKKDNGLGTKFYMEMALAVVTLKYELSFAGSPVKGDFDVKNIMANSSKNLSFEYWNSPNKDNIRKFEISEAAYENSNKYIFFDYAKNNTVLENECAIVLSQANFKEIKSKGETKMDFGNGLETFKFIMDGTTNNLYKGTFKAKKEIVLANNTKTIIIGFLDYPTVPLITKIKTPEKLMKLWMMKY